MFFVKDVESTSGSGPESFYTPEPSPTDRDSDSSGELCSRVFTFVFVQCMYVCVLLTLIFVSAEKPVRGSTPVFEFVDPDIQVRIYFSVYS